MISLKAYSQGILTVPLCIIRSPLTGLRNPKAMLLRNFGVMKWAMGFHKESLELFEEVPMGKMQLGRYLNMCLGLYPSKWQFCWGEMVIELI